MTERVVSTAPSSTEILYSLGVEPVAVSHACDYPPQVRDRPVIDESVVDAVASADRHEQARTAAANGELYQLDIETLESVDPTVIVTQRVCGVCAVDEPLVKDAVSRLPIDPSVVTLQAHGLSGVFDSIETVGDAIRRDERAAQLVSTLRERLAAIERRRPAARPRTAVLEWMDPPRVAGSWVPELVEAAGGSYGLGTAGERSVAVEWEELCAYDPERLVVSPCGFDLDRTRRQCHELTQRPGWTELQAVRTNQVYGLDGSSHLTRWTPRLVDAAEHLARICHPDVFGPPTAVDGVEQLLSNGAAHPDN